MKLHFDNGHCIDIELVPGGASNALTKIYKHLQHVPLNFKKWDNPFYLDGVTLAELIENLKGLGNTLGVDVDINQCLPFQQSYYNQLHKIYELAYDGTPAWLDFHEHIHLCELHHKNIQGRPAYIDYRERAGPLTKQFDKTYLSNMITTVEPGMVYIEWAELGKPPYNYWADNEPDDLTRLCQLAKPWLTFKPKLCIATQHKNLLSAVDPNFHQWWTKYQSDWCKHWQIDQWSLEHMRSVIQVGTVTQLNSMIDLFKQQALIEKVSL